MENYRVLLFTLILLVFYACTTIDNETKSITEGEKVVNTDQVRGSDFDIFLSNFKKVELPFNLTIDSPHWIDFSKGKSGFSVIPRDKIKKYFYANDDELWKARKFDQYYYGNTFLFNENLVGVTYYGTSIEDNDITGYQLVLFNRKGAVKNSLIIAGTTGLFDTEMQMEAEISKGTITINKIELEVDKIKDPSRFKGKQKVIVYQVSEDGSLKKDHGTAYTIKTFTTDEEHYRIKILE